MRRGYPSDEILSHQGKAAAQWEDFIMELNADLPRPIIDRLIRKVGEDDLAVAFGALSMLEHLFDEYNLGISTEHKRFEQDPPKSKERQVLKALFTKEFALDVATCMEMEDELNTIFSNAQLQLQLFASLIKMIDQKKDMEIRHNAASFLTTFILIFPIYDKALAFLITSADGIIETEQDDLLAETLGLISSYHEQREIKLKEDDETQSPPSTGEEDESEQGSKK